MVGVRRNSVLVDEFTCFMSVRKTLSPSSSLLRALGFLALSISVRPRLAALEWVSRLRNNSWTGMFTNGYAWNKYIFAVHGSFLTISHLITRYIILGWNWCVTLVSTRCTRIPQDSVQKTADNIFVVLPKKEKNICSRSQIYLHSTIRPTVYSLSAGGWCA